MKNLGVPGKIDLVFRPLEQSPFALRLQNFAFSADFFVANQNRACNLSTLTACRT
jgi:hypothetical protein